MLKFCCINTGKDVITELLFSYILFFLAVEPKKQSSCTIRLINKSQNHVAFKV